MGILWWQCGVSCAVSTLKKSKLITLLKVKRRRCFELHKESNFCKERPDTLPVQVTKLRDLTRASPPTKMSVATHQNKEK